MTGVVSDTVCPDTAYCINPHKRKFYSFDDNVVKEILPRQVKVRSLLHFLPLSCMYIDTCHVLYPLFFAFPYLQTAAAYVLFYTSVDFTPPKLFATWMTAVFWMSVKIAYSVMLACVFSQDCVSVIYIIYFVALSWNLMYIMFILIAFSYILYGNTRTLRVMKVKRCDTCSFYICHLRTDGM